MQRGFQNFSTPVAFQHRVSLQTTSPFPTHHQHAAGQQHGTIDYPPEAGKRSEPRTLSDGDRKVPPLAGMPPRAPAPRISPSTSTLEHTTSDKKNPDLPSLAERGGEQGRAGTSVGGSSSGAAGWLRRRQARRGGSGAEKGRKGGSQMRGQTDGRTEGGAVKSSPSTTDGTTPTPTPHGCKGKQQKKKCEVQPRPLHAPVPWSFFSLPLLSPRCRRHGQAARRRRPRDAAGRQRASLLASAGVHAG